MRLVQEPDLSNLALAGESMGATPSLTASRDLGGLLLIEVDQPVDLIRVSTVIERRSLGGPMRNLGSVPPRRRSAHGIRSPGLPRVRWAAGLFAHDA